MADCLPTRVPGFAWSSLGELTGAFRGRLNLPSKAAHHFKPAIQARDSFLIVGTQSAGIVVVNSALRFFEQEVDSTHEPCPYLFAHYPL